MNYTVHEPLGVVVRIISFNHPLMFICIKMAAPLAAGNTLIMKPGEQTPLSALRLAELIHGILPPGVFNLLNGQKQTGAALVAHPDVANVSLVGSVPTGRAVLRGAAETIKRTVLELGGKNAMIIDPDADADKSAASAVHGMNFSWTAGQSCGSISRVFIHASLYDRVVQQITYRVGDIKLGIPSDPATEMGCR